jgi:putative DNA primase/helicase
MNGDERNESGALLEAARRWRKIGYVVVGVGPSKVPYAAGWSRFFDEPQTAEQVNAEFANGTWGVAGVLYPACDFVHLDFDGTHARDAWEKTGIELPETGKYRTRSGGEHLVYRASRLLRKTPIKRKVRIVSIACGCADEDGSPKPCGVDLLLRGIAVLPPSGNGAYKESRNYPVESAVELPDAIVKLAKSQQKQAKEKTTSGEGRIKQGERKATACSLAGSMRARGMSIEAIRAALRADSEQRFDPPLDDDEIEDVLKSAAKWNEDEPLNLTDLGNAARFAKLNADAVLYSAQRKKWLLWSGNRWRWDETGAIFDRAEKTVKSIYTEAAQQNDKDRRQALNSHAAKSEARGKIEAMLALAQARPEIRISLDALDRRRDLINCRGATIDTTDGRAGAPRREDLLTLRAGARYDADALCPRWEKFLTEITDEDDSLAQFLQRSVGYCLTGDTSEQCFWVLYGNGSNGKTTFINVILRLLGDYATQIKTEVLIETRYDASKDYHLAALAGKRFVAACESKMGQKLASNLLKQASGSDLITARRPFEQPFSFYPEFKLWLSTNQRPSIDDSSDAMWRRIHAVPFTAKFLKASEAPQGYDGPLVDTELPEQLKAELPGILNWAIEGCLEWRKRRLDPPKVVRNATRQYREDEDVLGLFLADCCERIDDPEQFETAKDLYQRFCNWAKENNERPWRQRDFAPALVAQGFKKDRTRKTGRIWRGIKLRKTEINDQNE